MLPRWLVGIAILIIGIWFVSDPAGFADFLKLLAISVGTFFSRLTS